MSFLGKTLTLILFAINVVVSLLFVVSSYSYYINPADHPYLFILGLVFPLFLLINIVFFLFWIFAGNRNLLLPLISIIICINPILTYFPLNITKKQQPEGAIKFLSYNIMGFGDSVKVDFPDNNIIKYLNNSDADILCLQEFMLDDSKSLKKVKSALKKYKYSDYHKLSGFNGLACFSRYPILSSSLINYKSEYNGSVIYKIKIGDDTLTVINNHLESNKLTKDDKEVYKEMILTPEEVDIKLGSKLLINKLAQAAKIRAYQADSISKYIENNPDDKFIVCGDFNDSPISYVRHKIGTGLNDSFADSSLGAGISYNRNHFYFRIDHILLDKRFKAYGCRVDNSIKSSDHYPIWCYISLDSK